jgi:hypothetical protein
MTPAEAMIAFAERGWSVLPLVTRGKVPLLDHGVRETSSRLEWARIWAARWPSCNFGVATGRASGAWVLDVDGAAGETSLEALEAEHGALPATTTVRTGRGRHLYWALAEIRSRIRFRPGLDTRAADSYVVGPCSVHETGSIYELVDSRPPVAAPEWLLSLIAPAPTAPLLRLPPLAAQARSERYGAAAVARECERVARTVPGQRNGQLFRSAAALGELVASRLVDEADARAALTAAAETAGLVDDDGARGVELTITSGLTSGARTPRNMPSRRTGHEILAALREMR